MGETEKSYVPAVIDKGELPQEWPEKMGECQEVMRQWLTPAIIDLAPKAFTPDRLFRVMRLAFGRMPKLRECTVVSVMGGLLDFATLNLEPHTPLGLGWLIPFRNEGVMEATVIIGYKGLEELVYRAGEVSVIQVGSVREGDKFDYGYGTSEFLSHRPSDGRRGDLTHAWVMATTRGGIKVFRVVDREEAMAHKAKSRGAKSAYSPWNDPQAEHTMWEKTAAALMCRHLRKSVELGLALALGERDEMGTTVPLTEAEAALQEMASGSEKHLTATERLAEEVAGAGDPPPGNGAEPAVAEADAAEEGGTPQDPPSSPPPADDGPITESQLELESPILCLGLDDVEKVKTTLCPHLKIPKEVWDAATLLAWAKAQHGVNDFEPPSGAAMDDYKRLLQELAIPL